MWKNVAIASGIGLAVLSSGGVALAATDPGAAKAVKQFAHHSGKHHGRGYSDSLHASWTTQGNGQKGSPKFVDHERIRGTVGDVTPESITVVSLDGLKETFTITKATQFTAPVVKEKQPVKKGVAGANVADQVLVVGTGPEKFTADLITDAGPAPKGAKLG